MIGTSTAVHLILTLVFKFNAAKVNITDSLTVTMLNRLKT